MAIVYHLHMATSLTTVEFARELRQADIHGVFDEAVVPADLLGDSVLTKLRTWIQVFEVNRSSWNQVLEDLGFLPTISVMFRQDKFTDMAAQDDDMVNLTCGLLDQVSGDAVLHFDYEEIWLLRRGCELSLNESENIWPPHRLALVRQPYRRATYAFS